MSGNNLLTLLPLIALTVAIVVIMVIIPFKRSHRLTLTLTLVSLIVCFALLMVPLEAGTPHATGLLSLDGYAIFFIGLLLAAAAATSLLAYGYTRSRKSAKEEFYILLLIATLGSSIIVSSSHFASFFLGLELLSVSLYVLIAYFRAVPFQYEAAIKYLILASTSVSFLLFGIALIYTDLGTMSFNGVSMAIASRGTSFIVLAGMVLLFIGIGFKLAVVPFHLWTPDVYQGAPMPVAAFIATCSKGALLALLLRYFSIVNFENLPLLWVILAMISIASMAVGNLLALLQNNMKRLLAYSSIAHMGYMLVALLASGTQAILAVAFYLIAYFITTLAAFGVLTVLSSREKEFEDLADCRGLAFRHFWLSALLTTALLSLAGIPLTAGFIGKFLIVTAGVGARLWALVIILILNSAVSLFYYLRVIIVLYSDRPVAEYGPEGAPPIVVPPSYSLLAGFALAVLAFLLVLVGVFPAPFFRLIQVLAMHLA